MRCIYCCDVLDENRHNDKCCISCSLEECDDVHPRIDRLAKNLLELLGNK